MATKVIYVSKTGLDGNSGLTPLLAKLTLAGAKAILQAGENTIYVGVGEYTETTGWDGSGKFVDIIGDYDGAIFGGGSGTVKQTSSASHVMSTVRSYSRLTLKISASSKYFIYGSTADARQYLTFNYIIFDAPASTYLIYGQKGTSYEINFNKITFNYCSQATTAMNAVNSSPWTFPIIFNNFNNITTPLALGVQASMMADVIFNNSSLLWGGGIALPGMIDNVIFMGGTLKQSAANSSFFGTTVDLTYNGCHGNILIKDCAFLSNTGSTINLNTNTYLSRVCMAFDYGCLNVIKGVFDATSYVLMNNVNTNGKLVYYFANGRMHEAGEVYNAKNVYYHNYTSNEATFHLLPLEGLAISTEYDLAFDYCKMENSASADYDIRFGVLKGSQMISHDLQNYSGNALVWADYLSSAHTYNTWYSKILTFTTTANIWDTYFLVYYTPIAQYNFKINDPVAA